MEYLKLITPPSTTPVSLADLKDHLTYTDNNSDARLTAYLYAAIDYCEKTTNLAICPQTWELCIPCFPHHNFSFSQYHYFPHHLYFRDNKIMLNKPPVTSVSFVKYYDSDNVLQTWDSSNYTVQLPHNRPAFIQPLTQYPTLCTSYRADAVQIQFVCGSSTPSPLFGHAIKLICGSWDAYREAEQDNNVAEIGIGVSRILGLLNGGIYV